MLFSYLPGVVFNISWEAIVGVVAFFVAVGPAVYTLGRFASRIEAIESADADRKPLIPRFLAVEQSVAVLSSGQQDMLTELKGLRSSFDRLVGRFEEADRRRALETDNGNN